MEQCVISVWYSKEAIAALCMQMFKKKSGKSISSSFVGSHVMEALCVNA